MALRYFKTILAFALLLIAGISKGQVIYQYGFENLPGNGTTTASPWTGTPDVLATGLSNSSWATNHTDGLFISYSGSCGNTSCQSLAISGNNYPASTTYTLTFTVNSGYALNVTGLSFWNRESTTGPSTINITINGTAAINNLAGAGTTGTNTGTLTPVNSFTNLTGTFTLVMTLTGATSSAGTFRLDDFVIDGTVTAVSSINNYNVTGGGSYCAGGTGVVVGLANSDNGVSYQLINGGTNVGSPVSGTGSAISFGLQAAAGTYTVLATNTTNSDTATMTGNAVIVINPAPTVSLATPAPQCGGTITLNAGNAGSTFLWGDNTTGQTDVASSTGTYTVTVTNTNTCSASASVSVTINTPPTIGITASSSGICSGGSATLTGTGGVSYLWSNSLTTTAITVNPASSATYTVTGTDNNTCTATASSTITVSNAITNSITTQICMGESYGGHNATNTYIDTFTSVGGCDSIRTLILTVLPAITSSTSQSICAGSSYQGHSTGGTYNDTLTTANGCDSIVTLVLTIQAPVVHNVSQTICSGQSYLGHSTPGNYNDTLTTVNGCDSVIALTLTVTPPVTGTSTSQTICAGTSYHGHNAPGTYNDTLTTANTGCDSIVSLTLTVSPPVTSSTTQTICAGSSYHGHTSSGNYSDTLSTVGAGCDSIVSVALTVLPPITLALTRSICKYDTFMGHTRTGNYTDTLISANGCDSIIYLQLTVNPLPYVSLTLTFDTVCNNSANITLSGGTPAGGYYSGQGVTGSQFIPSSAPIGFDTIYYHYTDSNGCYRKWYETAYTEECDSTLGIKQINGAVFTVLPNPVQDYLTIESTGTEGSYYLCLYDLLGQAILREPLEENNALSKTTLNLRDLPAGLYLLNIMQGSNKAGSYKIVKN